MNKLQSCWGIMYLARPALGCNKDRVKQSLQGPEHQLRRRPSQRAAGSKPHLLGTHAHDDR